MTNFGNQVLSHGNTLFSTIRLRHIELLRKRMLPECNTDINVGL